MAQAKASLPGDRVYPDLKAFFDDPESPTQVQIAKELRIGQPYLTMIKNHQREPDIKLALRIQHRCRVPLESLIRTRRKAS